MPTRPDDSFLDILLKAVGALATGDRELANAKATELAVDLPVERSRVPVTPTLTASVMRRDFFSCRYCGTRIIPSAVLRAASLVWPKELPYHMHWKASATHPLYLSHAGSIDHIEPHAHGGDPEALTNLATACWGSTQRSGTSLSPTQPKKTFASTRNGCVRSDSSV